MTDMAGSNPLARYGIHKAEPAVDGVPAHCIVCGQWVKLVPGGQGSAWVHSDSGAVAAPNPPCYKPEQSGWQGAGDWQLMHLGAGVLLTGTEQQVKAAAQDQVDQARKHRFRNHEAMLRSDLFLVKPDGSHQGQRYDDAGFVPGEAIQWIDVDW
jgi:hypothetical protein